MPRSCHTLVERRPKALLALDRRQEISLSRLPEEARQLPRYVKASTLFSTAPSMVMAGSVLGAPGLGWHKTSVFLMLTVSPKALAAVEKQSARVCRSSSEWAARAQSSAKRKSRMSASRTFVSAFRRRRSRRRPSVLYLMVMPASVWDSAAESITANSRLKSVGARTHPCFTPLVTGKGSDASPFSITLAIMPSWKDCMALTNFGGQPSLDRMTQRPGLLTVSKALVRSRNSKKRS